MRTIDPVYEDILHELSSTSPSPSDIGLPCSVTNFYCPHNHQPPEDPKPPGKGTLHYLYLCVCFCGWFWHLFTISLTFFEFETNSELTYETPSKLEAPSMTVCTKYPNVLAKDRLNAMDTLAASIDGKDAFSVFDMVQMLTASDILALTPREVISRCVYRMPNSYATQAKEGDHCHEAFLVSRFLVLNYVCYTFTPRMALKKTFEYRRIAMSSMDPNLFYSLSLKKETFAQTDHFRVLAHAADKLPYGLIGFAPFAVRGMNETTGETERDDFVLSYHWVETRLLSSPYSTDCRNYTATLGFDSAAHCFDECVARKVGEVFSNLPFTAITEKPLYMEMVSRSDIENATFSRQLNRLEQECSRICLKPDCSHKRLVTKVRGTYRSNELTFRLFVPDESGLKIVAKPRVKVSEYLTYAMSVFVIWFNVSFLDFSPKKLIALIKKSKKPSPRQGPQRNRTPSLWARRGSVQCV